ncbi:Dolichyl pyrophosphate phosphatase and related acid phosphatases [Ceraceosorus bombacis]|uniref:Dolichyldiphosphatase n=1 Tax=Ceraceosorus bombacis TaxID=401625 RepID=A0A0P1BQ36_9BASI|nr:Dolichyl pyrophosphate phosphatase and related acid phosphatases [Ceraceosorus bombacis]
MSAPGSSIDPSSYSVLGLTHVQYNQHDPFAKALALITLSPIFLLCSYVTIILYRRELTFINALIGQLGCEGVNWGLKRLIRQPRPTGNLGSGYGMPSSHAQFVGFFAAYFLAHFALHHPKAARPATLVNTMRRFEHAVAMLAIASCAAITAYSRYHLSYHTAAQIWVGLSLGIAIGSTWYYIAEYLPRKPLRLPIPLGSPHQSPATGDPSSRASARVEAERTKLGSPVALRQRQRKSISAKEQEVAHAGNQVSTTSPDQKRARRRSSLSSFLPELHPAPPLRQLILDHPIAVAFRIRDSWTVWLDGGIEQEYGRWRDEWLERRTEWRQDDALADSPIDQRLSDLPLLEQRTFSNKDDEGGEAWTSEQDEIHYRRLLKTLALADLCVANQTAFCVGCVISPSRASCAQGEQILATGYSRELPGNTHAEECALQKLLLLLRDSSMAAAFERETIWLDLYTSMEPCSVRGSGNTSCVSRILSFNTSSISSASTSRSPCSGGGGAASSAKRTGKGARACYQISRVFMGVKEPQDFVQCEGVRMLREAGVQVITVLPPDRETSRLGLKHGWLEREALRIAKKSHLDQAGSEGAEVAWKGLA